jgi:hypothetical protein
MNEFDREIWVNGMCGYRSDYQREIVIVVALDCYVIYVSLWLKFGQGK